MTGPRILLVEDNPITRRLVCFTLRSKGFTVVEAPDGATALSLFASGGADLVLQDLCLPDLDGFELVLQLRALPGGSAVPILAFSGFLSELEAARISVVGFDDVIVKPIEPSRLVKILGSHLPAPPPAAERNGAGRRLVVADDDEVQRKLACFRLAHLGYETVAAENGTEALELCRTAAPAGLVADVMMPGLDGFGLCAAIRREPGLSTLPVVLMTSSFVEAADLELARKAGASQLVFRTPDFRTVLEAVRESLAATSSPNPGTGVPPAELEPERARRTLRQLERQAQLNAGAAQRCATLSAEISVLGGISEALARSQDPDAVLPDLLAGCLDAGGISAGALFLAEPAGAFRVLSFGAKVCWTHEELAGFFGSLPLLRAIIAGKLLTAFPSPQVPEEQARPLLAASGSRSALVVPLVHGELPLGALLLVSSDVDLDQEDRKSFASAVAGQISVALALGRIFAEKGASEQKAREQAAVLTSVLESVAEGVLVTDESARVKVWNGAAERIVGPGLRELSGLPRERWNDHLGLFLPDQVTPLPVSEHTSVRTARGEVTDGMELFLRNPSRPEGAWLSVTARPLLDERGAFRGTVSTFRDTTAEKAAQEQLLLSEQMASVGLLAAGVAHEINNPLAAVVADVEFAIRELAVLSSGLGPGPELAEVGAALQEARESADRIRHIVRDLKLFSRAEEDCRGPVDVERVLESCLRMAAPELRHRAQLVRDYQEVPPVLANESRLGQVFLNLIVNAAQALPEGQADRHRVRVATRLDGAGQVVIEVADTGPGIPPEVRKRLFTPFFTTKPRGVGTGLGLSICLRLVNAVGGRIGVESAPGTGTVFRVSLPQAEPGLKADATSTPPGTAAVRRGRILVVDDEPSLCSVIARLLCREHEVETITSATEALQLLSAGARFDVILCDLMMPVMTGMDLYGQLLREVPDQAARIVFLTGGAFTARARAFLDEVPNQRLEKPFDPQGLRALINDRVR